MFLCEEGNLYLLGNLTEKFSTPTKIKEAPKRIKNISASRDFFSVLTFDKKLYCYGNASELKIYGAKIHEFTDINEDVEIASCSYDSLFFITTSGRAGVIGSVYKTDKKWNTYSENIFQLSSDKKEEFYIDCIGGKKINKNK